MELKDMSLRPGFVTNVESNGVIKAMVPQLFDMDYEYNPPIYPYTCLIGGQLKLPSTGDTVWVLSNKKNPLQLYWFGKADLPAEDFTNDLMGTPTILASEETDMGESKLYFTEGDGWNMEYEDASINMTNNEINLRVDWPNKAIKISEDAIVLGGKGEHTVAYGDETADVLQKICNILELAAQAAKSNPYTMHLAPIFEMVDEVKEYIIGIQSNNVKID